MARTASDFNRNPRERSGPATGRVTATPPPIHNEAGLITRLSVWLNSHRGTSLDLPGEFAPLADSRTLLPNQSAAHARVGPGNHTAGQVVQRFNALGILTHEIDVWSRLPVDDRVQLADYLHAHVRGLLTVPLDTALTWLGACLVPVPEDLAARLDLPAGVTWGAAWQGLAEPAAPS